MLSIHPVESINKDKFFNFLKNEFINSNEPAAKNLWHDDWKNHNFTIPFLLEHTTRFKNNNGQFHIVKYYDEIIGCGGVYKSDFCKDLTLAATRTWVNKKFRNQSILKDLTLVEHKKWSIENHCKAVALCFNDYNKNLIQIFKRNRLGEKNNRIKTRLPKNLFYNGLEEIEFPITIQFTKQWIIYEKLDNSFNFDWTSIRYFS